MPSVFSLSFGHRVVNSLRSALLASACFTLFSLPANAQIIDHSQGFATHNDLTANGISTFNGTTALLTPNRQGVSGTVFSNEKVSISRFTNTFTFSMTNFGGSGHGGPGADGIIFIIQSNAPTSIGVSGGNLGFVGIGNSVGVKFDIYQNAGDPSNNCTGLFTNGAGPYGGINLNSTGVNLRSGNLLQADMSYDGSVLKVTITDTVTHHSASQTYTVDIPRIVNSQTAYVGFGSGTGASDATQQIGTWKFTSGSALPWGAHVQVAFKDQTAPAEGYLVAGSKNAITLSRDLDVDGTGKVSVNKTYLRSNIQSLTIVADASTFNKYIVDYNNHQVRTFKLNGYSGGVWSLDQHSISGNSRVTTPTPIPDANLNSFVAIYRADAPSPAPTNSDVRGMLIASGTRWKIPPHVLYGLAYQESGAAHRWKQFGLNDLGNADGKTCVTWDGGIGLMQLTQAAATEDTLPADGDLLSHMLRLGAFTAYNIDAGARKLSNLKAKDEISPRKRPAIGSGDRRLVETWYFALWGYNGWSNQNDPNQSNSPYQQSVFNGIASGPTGYWTWGLSLPGVPDRSDIGTGPGWKTTPYIPAPWHFDANYDGKIVEYSPMLAITKVTATKSGSIVTVSVELTNNGATNAPNVRLTSGMLGGNPTTSSLSALGRHTIAQKDKWTLMLKFSANGLLSGTSAGLNIAGAYTGEDVTSGTPFSTSGTVTIP